MLLTLGKQELKKEKEEPVVNSVSELEKIPQISMVAPVGDDAWWYEAGRLEAEAMNLCFVPDTSKELQKVYEAKPVARAHSAARTS